MSVSFKAKLLSAITNAAYLSKTTADIALAKLGLSDSDAGNNSGASIDNTQKFINQIADSSGETEGDANRKIYSSNNYILNGDSKKVTIGKLDTQAKVNADGIQTINDSVGQPNGIASLDSGGQVPAAQLPSYVDDVEEYADLASFPVTGETGKIYVALDTNITYRWSGSSYIEISPNLIDSVNGYTGTVVLNNTDIGLGNVTNDAQLKRSAADIDTFTEKVTPVIDDIVLIEDSEDLFNKKKVKLSSITTDTSDKANTDLGNLAATSINQSLIPSADQSRDLGSASKKWSFAHVTDLQSAQGGDINGAWRMGDSFASNQMRIAGSSGFTFKGITINGYVRSVGANKSLAIYSENASQTGKVLIASGDASSGSSGEISVITGDSTVGANTGNINIKTGTGGSTRGDVVLEANTLNLSSTIVKNGVDPVDPKDLATKDYVDNNGGGGGGLETYYTNDLESFLISDIQETGNGTYGGGGTFDGALSIESVEVIAGSQSFKYTGSTASLNDYFIIDSAPIKDRERAITNARKIWVNASNFTNDFEIITYDQTNLTIIDSQTVKAGTELLEYIIDFNLIPTVNDINFGFKMGTVTNGDSFTFDNIELTTDPFVYANLNEENVFSAKLDGSAGAGVSVISSNTDFIQSITRSAAGNFTVTWKPGFFTQPPVVTASNEFSSGTSNSVSVQGVTSTSGQFLVRHGNALVDDDFSIMVQRQGSDYKELSEHVITPSRSNINEYTARITSAGVVTSEKIAGTFTASTGSGTITVDYSSLSLSVIPSTSINVEHDPSTGSLTYGITAISTSSVTYTFSLAGTGPVTRNISFSLTKHEEDTQNAKFIAALPPRQIAYLKDVKPSGTAGGTFTSGVWQTRDLNTVSGTSFIVSLSSNQFTLQEGTYKIKALAPGFDVQSHKIKLRDISNSLDTIIGSSEITNTAADVANSSHLEGEIVLSSSTVFEIQHRCSITATTQGFGFASGFGVDEIYTQVEIEKIK